jgi:hypothetical protein
MHKSATKCNKTSGKWCKNKHGASKIIDTLETYHRLINFIGRAFIGKFFHQSHVLALKVKKYAMQKQHWSIV